MANRVSTPQLEFLAHCMEQFPTLALASFKSREEMGSAHSKWLQIGSALNKIKPGLTKTEFGWLKYWTNYKYQLRRRYPQFKHSWVSDQTVHVPPLVSRFLQALADHERNEPTHGMSDHNAESRLTTYEEEKGDYTKLKTTQSMPTKRKISQSMPTKRKISQSMPTKQKTSQSVPTKRKTSQSMPTKRKTTQSMPTKQQISQPVSSKQRVWKRELPVHYDDNNSMQCPIGTIKDIKEEIQTEILKFTLKRQKEMHELEMTQMKEKHILEFDILQLKKKKLMQDCDRIRSNIFRVINN